MVGNGARTIAVKRGSAANDDSTADSRVESTVLTIARIIGRQIAREAFERARAVNDNAPASEAGKDQETR